MTEWLSWGLSLVTTVILSLVGLTYRSMAAKIEQLAEANLDRVRQEATAQAKIDELFRTVQEMKTNLDHFEAEVKQDIDRIITR